VYFLGNAPTVAGASGVFGSVFYNNAGTVYYLPGTVGWSYAFGGRPTAWWLQPNPSVLSGNSTFGFQNNAFGFDVSWATNVLAVVQATTNLANPVWTPVYTNSLTNGWFHFSDPQWSNYPGRYYRVAIP